MRKFSFGSKPPLKEHGEGSFGEYSSGIFRFKSLLSSTVHREDEKLTNIFQSFISPRIIAAAQISFPFLKALYQSFQMLRRAFQISVEFITEASLKNFYMRFQWFFQLLCCQWLGKNNTDTNNNSHQIIQ